MLKSFRDSLTSFKEPVLFAHNSREFDSIFFCNAMQKVLSVNCMNVFQDVCDTFDFFKAILPNQEKFGITYSENFIQRS